MPREGNKFESLVSQPASVACVSKPTTVAPKSASLVTLRLPRAVQNASTVVIEPLNSTVVILGCAAMPAVCALIADVCRVAVVNKSDKPINICAEFFIASVNPVCPVSKSSKSAATASRLPHESKIRKVLHELKIDSLPYTAPHKKQLLSLVGKYLDILAECKSKVGASNLTFYKIDTGDVRFLCQPVCRVSHGKLRAAVEFEVD